MKQQELNEVLRLHELWLKVEEGGKRADLRGANLTNANLTGANMPMFCRWSLSIVDGKVTIGCKTKTIEEWDAFFASDEVYETKRGTDEFLQIQAVYNAHKAYLQTLNTKQHHL